jgi:hypothetical protein
MRALNLSDLNKRWRCWRELEHLQHSMGISPLGEPADIVNSDDARAEPLPDDLIEPRPTRLD